MSERGTNASGERGLKRQSQEGKRALGLAVVGHVGPVATGDVTTASHALAALGQPTRLEIFRLLVRGEPSGMLAGAIADTVGCPHNTSSSHLSILARAGLVHGSRDGRTIVYRADVEGMRALMAFLITECCDARPELCNLTKRANEPCYDRVPTSVTEGKKGP